MPLAKGAHFVGMYHFNKNYVLAQIYTIPTHKFGNIDKDIKRIGIELI